MTSDKTDTTIRTAGSTAETSLVDALNEYTVPLDTDDPTAPVDDLDPLRELLSNRRVVGLGEATHGTREFFRLKHRLIRYLVEDLEFRIIGLEANFSETLAINEYVLYGEGTPVDALDATHFWIWTTEEVVAFLDWLRAYNRDRPVDQRVSFYGFDTQFTSGPARAIADFLGTVDPATLKDVQDGLATLKDGLRSEDELDTKLERAGPVIDELQTRFDHNEQRYTESTSAPEFELAHRHLRTLEQAYIVNEKLHRDEGPWIARDEFMAENVSWILDYEDSEQIVLWAHNGHIRRGGQDDSPDSNHTPMGHYLNDTFGADYYALGFDFGAGSFQAIADQENSDESGITEFSVDTLSYDVFDESTGEESLSRERLAETPLHDVLHRVGNNFVFLDFETGLADPLLRDWLTQTNLCYSIGAVFGEEDVAAAYLPLRMAREFNGLLYVQETNRARHIVTE